MDDQRCGDTSAQELAEGHCLHRAKADWTSQHVSVLTKDFATKFRSFSNTQDRFLFSSVLTSPQI